MQKEIEGDRERDREGYRYREEIQRMIEKERERGDLGVYRKREGEKGRERDMIEKEQM